MPSPATFVLRRARIYTLDPATESYPTPEFAEAAAVRNGRVVATGSESAVWSHVPEGSAAVDLGGRVVLPGFTDAHTHWASYAIQRKWLTLTPEQSLPDVLKSVRAAAARKDAGDWIVGRGWDHTPWGRWPSAADLDPVSGGAPVVLIRKDGHVVWANTAALRAAGVDSETPDPPGGEIVRSGGSPTGILKEAASALVRRALPTPASVDRQAALVDSWPDAWSRGITGCHDMGYQSGALFRDLSTLRDAGELGLRFVWYLLEDALDEAIALGLRSGLGDEWLRVGGLKLFLDGTLGAQTAHMLAPYAGQGDNTGIALMDDAHLAERLRTAADARLATALHAIGDAAVRRALDGIAAIGADHPRGRLRHRIEHLQLVDPADVPRFATLGVAASVQPLHLVADALLVDKYWPDRAPQAYPWRDLRDAGARLVFGSDVPVEAPDVFAAIQAAVTRGAGRGLRPWQPQQSIGVLDALLAYTAAPAWISGQEESLGTLMPGRRADLIVVDRDPFTTSLRDIVRTKVLATMIDGVWVWQRPEVDYAGPRG